MMIRAQQQHASARAGSNKKTLSDRAAKDLHVVRDRISDGMRVASYAVRTPHRIISYVQLLKQASEHHVTVPRTDCVKFRDALRGSDNDIDNFFDGECHELLRAIHVRDAAGTTDSRGEAFEPYEDDA